MKIITFLEGEVLESKWQDLKQAYAKVSAEALGIMPLQSFLVQSNHNPKLWRIISLWQDAETLNKIRASGETPAGVLVFQTAGSKPSLSLFEVQSEI